MKRIVVYLLSVLAFCTVPASRAKAQIKTLLATGQLTSSRAGDYKDLSGLNYNLESGKAANLLGGLGSGLAYVSGNTFLALPDRGPNVEPYNPLIDNTVSYIDRFHTIEMGLQLNTSGFGLPFMLTPELKSTTLLHALLPLAYGDGKAYGVPSGAPPLNSFLRHYFTGRSDNFDARFGSADPFDARFDPESIRVSNDGLFVYISDEYGPYVYEFIRATGERVRSFQLPAELYVAQPEPVGTACPATGPCSNEQTDNSSGRVPNKGMEGLAITPDGKTLVGLLQAPTLQDVKENASSKLLRGVVIDIRSGRTIKEFAYLLTTGSGVSDVVAINDHEFLVDERDGKGLGDGSNAKIKQFFKINLANAQDIQGMHESTAASFAVPKSTNPVLDMVAVLKANGTTVDKIPSKIEGTAFGPDVTYQGIKMHTLWIANDNDFDQDNSGPNVFYVFGFTDADLGDGSVLVPQGRTTLLQELFHF